MVRIRMEGGQRTRTPTKTKTRIGNREIRMTRIESKPIAKAAKSWFNAMKNILEWSLLRVKSMN